MAIKVYLDEQLRARGITAKELCARVGITEANLSILRSGKAKGVRFHTINRICYYLQCDVGDILKFDGELDATDVFVSLIAQKYSQRNDKEYLAKKQDLGYNKDKVQHDRVPSGLCG